MRYKFQTRSGAQYIIDEDEMTWKRFRPDMDKTPDVIGLEGQNEGRLEVIPAISIGYRAFIDILLPDGEATYIHSTTVERIELLDD